MQRMYVRYGFVVLNILVSQNSAANLEQASVEDHVISQETRHMLDQAREQQKEGEKRITELPKTDAEQPKLDKKQDTQNNTRAKVLPPSTFATLTPEEIKSQAEIAYKLRQLKSQQKNHNTPITVLQTEYGLAIENLDIKSAVAINSEIEKATEKKNSFTGLLPKKYEVMLFCSIAAAGLVGGYLGTKISSNKTESKGEAPLTLAQLNTNNTGIIQQFAQALQANNNTNNAALVQAIVGFAKNGWNQPN